MAASLDNDLSQATQKKDWPEVVLILSGAHSQNFEHEMTLGKALLHLERRAEALALGVKLYSQRKDERTRSFLELAGNLFFNQETSNLYYEAIRLLSILKFPEARERLELALTKEPGNTLILTRLVQVEIALSLKEPASQHLKIAQENAPFSTELKLFGAKVALETEDQDTDWYREFSPLRSVMISNEVTACFWYEALKRAGKSADLNFNAETTLQKNPNWSYALFWFYQHAGLSEKTKLKIKTQLEKNLKDKDAFQAYLENEMKQTQYYWVGFVSYDQLLKNLK